MDLHTPSNHRAGSVGFLITLGVVLTLFAALMLARPWETKAPDSVAIADAPASETTPVVSPPATEKPADTTIKTPQLDTASWKTYRNEEYGFEVQFPYNWSFAELHDDNPVVKTVLHFVPVPENAPWGDSFHGSISVRTGIKNFPQWFNDQQTSAETKVARVNEVYGENFLRPEDLSYTWYERTVAGAPAIETITTCQRMPRNQNCFFFGAPHGYAESWYIWQNNKVVTFSILTYSLNEEQIEKISAILSTFKFIE